jgi:asparagine synthetase B (glutamine-hydrolysing)
MSREFPRSGPLAAEQQLEANSAPLRGAVGFVLLHKADVQVRDRIVVALSSLLQYFPWLRCGSFRLGTMEVILWSHRPVEESTDLLPNGEGLFLIGSSPTLVKRDRLWPGILQDDFQLPWSGRTILVKVAPSGDDWYIWTDWCGSIPVYHSIDNGLAVISSLEPLVVEAKAWGKNDLSPRGVVELLRFGHLVGTHTAFQKLRNLAPDSRSIWRQGRHQESRPCHTIRPSDDRWGVNPARLVEEAAAITKAAIRDGLQSSEEWILPLSGGLDSRLIAGEMAQLGKRVHAFTYDTSYRNLVCGREVAAALRFPWVRVHIPPSFLERYTPMWMDWFGSSLQAHGMYQLPFLETVRELGAQIAVGFLGGSLAGEVLCQYRAGEPFLDQLARLSAEWPRHELEHLLTFDPEPIYEEIQDEICDTYSNITGEEFQRFTLLNLWTRQRHLTFYHPLMCDYWKGVSTPYLQLDFAQFCLSLPLRALNERQLFIDLLTRHYPHLARIPGTFTADGKPPIQAGLFRLRHGIGRRLPRSLKRGPFAVFDNKTFSRTSDAVRKSGLQALFPMGQKGAVSACPLFRDEAVERLLDQALLGDCAAIGRVARLQPVINRCLKS